MFEHPPKLVFELYALKAIWKGYKSTAGNDHNLFTNTSVTEIGFASYIHVLQLTINNIVVTG